MANELRQYSAFQGGMLDAKIDTTAGGSFTFSSPAFANLPVVNSAHHMLLTIDPLGLNGSPEVAKVTSHGATATTVTATGSQNTSLGRVHYQNEYWTAALETDDLGSNGDSTWIVVGSGGSAPAFQNSWVNFGGVYAVAAFRKLISGLVTVKGVVRNGTAGAAMFTLPVGYRPLETLTMTVLGSSSAIRELDVAASGTVIIFSDTFCEMYFSFYAEQ